MTIFPLNDILYRLPTQELIKKEIINTETSEYNQLSGGTSSELYLLNNKDNGRYVVKMNESKVLEASLILEGYLL